LNDTPLSRILSSEHTFENFYRRHPYPKSTPHTSVCIAVYMYTHIHICIHTHTCIHIHTCLYIHTYIYIYIDIHIYICIYTHTHVYTHAHTHSTYLSLHCCTDKTKQNIEVVCHHVIDDIWRVIHIMAPARHPAVCVGVLVTLTCVVCVCHAYTYESDTTSYILEFALLHKQNKIKNLMIYMCDIIDGPTEGFQGVCVCVYVCVCACVRVRGCFCVRVLGRVLGRV